LLDLVEEGFHQIAGLGEIGQSTPLIQIHDKGKVVQDFDREMGLQS
jgi:hypothetical protein